MIGDDGSYMPHLANDACTCAVFILCSYIDQYAEVTWAEKSTKKVVNNDRVEISGGCSTQLIVKAAITGHSMDGHHELMVGCENLGVV